MIPKKIHYCWFGGNPLPELAQTCIASWKKYCPDYEIIEWNESNFDFSECAYACEAYEAKKWAFVTDYVRLKVLCEYGGLYMDTDVEVIKPLDSLLQFDAVSGFESETKIPTGLIACSKGSLIFKELLHEYDTAHFLKEDGTPDLTTNVERITKALIGYGLQQNNTLQTVAGLTLLPSEYLCPKSFDTGELTITDNTLVIHHFDGSWLPDEEKYANELTHKLLKKIHNQKAAHRIALMISFTRYKGFFKMPKAMIEYKISNMQKMNGQI